MICAEVSMMILVLIPHTCTVDKGGFGGWGEEEERKRLSSNGSG